MIRAGLTRERIPLAGDRATLADLVAELASRYGEDLREELERACYVTIRRGQGSSARHLPARADMVLRQGDEIAFLYPFTGG